MADLAEIGFVAQTDQLEKANEELKKLKPSAEKLQKATDKLNERLRDANGRFIGVKKASDQVNESFTKTDKSVRKIASGSNLATKGLNKIKKAAAGAVGSIIALGAAAVGLGQSITAMRQFGAAVAEVTTLMDTNAQQTKLLEKNARDLGIAYGTGATAQVKAFYQAISAGAGDVEAATKLLDQANKLAIGGVTDVTTAVDILTTATNVYGATGLTASEASDALFVAMKAGKTTITELSASLGKVLPLASNLGVSFDETAAATAALTKGGINTAESVTGLRAAMTAVLGPSKQASDLAKQLGLDFSAGGLEAKGFAGFMQEVVDKTGGSSVAMQTLFGSVEATTVALALSGEAGGFLAEILGDMETKAGATQTAFDKMSETFDQRLNRAMSALADIGLTFGNMLLTVLVPALEGVVTAIGFVSNNMEIMGVIFAGLAATQLPAVIAAIGAKTLALAALTTGAGIASAALGVLRGALALLGGPLGIIAGLLTAGAAAWVIYGRDAKSASDDASAALSAAQASTDALNTALGHFANSAAPGAGAQAIELANDNYKLADSALAAAKAELAKAQAMSNSMKGGISGARDLGFQEERNNAVTEALKKQTRAQQMLADAERARARTARMITSTMDFNKPVEETKKLVEITETLGGSSGGAAKKVDDLAEEIKRLEDAVKKGGTPLEKFNNELENLNKLKAAGLSDAAYSMELERMNEELANSIPMVNDVANAFGDWVARGFKDFKSFKDAVLSSFRSMLSEMISTAARNAIVFNGTMAGGGGAAGAAGQVAQGAGIMGKVSGLASTVIGGFGPSAAIGGGVSATLGSLAGGTGLIGGAGNVVAGLATNGLAGAGAAITKAVGAATTGLGAAATAIGAVALPLLAVFAAFKFFQKKVENLDAGLKVTIDGMDSLVETFSTDKTTRFFGLSKKTRTTTKIADAATADPIEAAVNGIQVGIMNAASFLNIGAEAFESFATKIELSTKGMNQDQAQQALANEFGRISEEFAGMIPGLAEFQLQGETLTGTLDRISVNLIGVNQTMQYFNNMMFDLNVHSAGVASELVQMIGGLEAFGQVHSFFAQNFFNAQEQFKMASDELIRNFNTLGIEVPKTNNAFRDLVYAQDLSTTAGRAMYAELLKIAPAFIEVENAAKSLAEEAARAYEEAISEASRISDDRARNAASALSSAFGDLERSVNAAIEPLRAQLANAQEAVNESKNIVDKLRSALNRMRLPSDLGSSRISAQDTLRGMLGGGRLRDTQAFEEALSVVQEPSEGLFASFEEYQRDFFKTAGTIAALERTGIKQLSADEKIVSGIERQVSSLEMLLENNREQNTILLSIEEALKNLAAARAEVAVAGSGGGASNSSTFSDKTFSGWSREQKYLANNPDVLMGIQRGEFKSGAEHFKLHGQFENRPQFARGGFHSGGLRMVGEQGPEMEATGPARIYSMQQTKAMLSGRNGDMDQALVDEMRAMKQQLAAILRDIANDQSRERKILEEWQGFGLPKERTDAA